MKKFNFKTLLILALVLILAFSLVACNKDKEKDIEEEDIDPNEIRSEQFFNDLWAASNSIGKEKIDEDDDIGVSADLSLKVKLQDKDLNALKEIDLGIALQIFYDRTGTYTALKAKLYNAKDDLNWFTVYFYMNDPTNLYIDFDNQQIKFGLDFGWNDNLAEYLNDFMNNKIIGDAEKGTALSIEDILSNIAKTTGDNFDLNSLINAVLDIIASATGGEFDIAKLISDYKSYLDMLKIENLLKEDDKGNKTVDLKAAFNSTMVKSFLNNSKCIVNDDGTKDYSTTLRIPKQINTALASAVAKSGLGDLINGINIDLNFGVDNDKAIDGFKLVVNIPGLAVQKTIKDKTTYVTPVVELAINNLEFIPFEEDEVDEETAITYFGMSGEYSPNVSLDASIKIEANGVTLKANQINKWTTNAKTCVFNDTFTINIQGGGNVGKDEDGNDKEFYLYVDIENSKGGKAVQAAWDGKTVKILLDNTVPGCLDENKQPVPFVEEVVNCFGGWIYKLLSDSTKGNYKEVFRAALLKETETGSGEYVYNGKDTVAATINIDLNALVGLAAGRIGAKINEATAEDDVIKVKEQYLFEMSSLKTIFSDIVDTLITEKTVSIDGEDTLLTNNIVGIALPKTLGEIVRSWFKAGGSLIALGSWYPRIIAYNQDWVDAGIDLNIFGKEDLYKIGLDAVRSSIVAGAEALKTKDTEDDDKAYNNYKAAVGESKAVDAAIYWTAVEDVNTIYKKQIPELKDCETDIWYNLAFTLKFYDTSTLYKLVDRAKLDKVWKAIEPGAKALLTNDAEDDEKAYNNYKAVVGNDKDGKSKAVDADIYWKAVKKLDLLYGNKILEFNGCKTNTWYEIVFEKVDDASVIIDLNDGVKVEVKAKTNTKTTGAETASAAVTVELNAKVFEEGELAKIYEGLFGEEITTIFDFGEVEIPEE